PVADEPGLAARRMAQMLDAEPDRAAVLARFVSGLAGSDEELLRRLLGEGIAGGGGAGRLRGGASRVYVTRWRQRVPRGHGGRRGGGGWGGGGGGGGGRGCWG